MWRIVQRQVSEWQCNAIHDALAGGRIVTVYKRQALTRRPFVG